MFYLGFRRENFQKLELEKNKSQRLFLASQLLQQSLPLLKELGGQDGYPAFSVAVVTVQVVMWLFGLDVCHTGTSATQSRRRAGGNE